MLLIYPSFHMSRWKLGSQDCNGGFSGHASFGVVCWCSQCHCPRGRKFGLWRGWRRFRVQCAVDLLGSSDCSSWNWQFLGGSPSSHSSRAGICCEGATGIDNVIWKWSAYAMAGIIRASLGCLDVYEQLACVEQTSFCGSYSHTMNINL